MNTEKVSSGPTVTVNVDTTAERAIISPYIYGANPDYWNNEGLTPTVVTASRLGGNRLTGYNWENNASNAGNDWQHSSDNYLTMHFPPEQQNIPGIVVTNFHDNSRKYAIPYSLITLQMAGYVAKDKNGTVTESETAPSVRWVEVSAAKGSAFSDTPDISDKKVYMDELVHFLIKIYKNAASPTGIKGYSLDNEPCLWASTHPRIHPNKVGCVELIAKSSALAGAVKAVDPHAEIFGPVLYGMGAYTDLQGAPDWNSVKGNCRWFIDYYLEQMKKASGTAGVRLLDVLDIHYYPEARGGGMRITDQKDFSNIACNKARLQAPRTLWDATYQEDSWIGEYRREYLPILPVMQKAIGDHFSGTKLAITEYNFGGNDHISGGIAQADVFGILGREGVYLAAFWPFSGGSQYIQAAFNLYRNYDGHNSTYGQVKVRAETSDIENTSVYAAETSFNNAQLHIIAINKNYDQAATVNFKINGGKNYTSGQVWAFDKNTASVTQRSGITTITNNQFSYVIPELTASHIVLEL